MKSDLKKHFYIISTDQLTIKTLTNVPSKVYISKLSKHETAIKQINKLVNK